ncbi:cryptochrome/photolyase family protein [Cellulomonas fengjieae]|uniref:Deoxyribodipyrimidine photo-lyase n=1 Tax=Cellulomonas fengjieae TaxID=2819978 RepID=A0ABS3SGG7_9CELL|nr:deoxyribodipyrimidine photo-lyase [Cellulomonas fengjieae]MBO3084851.1 deoxyribodipyrimidine photo-lyase [Cellulomonas fengjieae]QVI66835.1 deoxyribodipyrimidine photo-lyase [Cellulomonas fengjieae]
MATILWFRRDLRLADNPALVTAVERAASCDDEVVPLFVVDPALWRPSAAPRVAYLTRSLRALDESLGGRLVVRHGTPSEVLPAVAREVAAAAVHVTAATEPYGRRRDDAVERALDVPLVPTGSPYAVAPGRLTTQAGTPYQVFTPFRAAWLDHGWHAPARQPQDVRWAQVRSDGIPDEPTTDVRLPAAGERAARARWSAYVQDGLERYGTERDRPDIDGTSRLSVPLKYGELHPRTLLADLAAFGSDVATFRSQLAWREFHADVLWHHPGAARSSLREVVPPDAWDPGDAAFDAWAAGRTGYPIVDAGMRQLRALGWVHNRVRMVVASFLVKDLHVRWQRGARYFMERLVDGDVAQNQLNWQWVAGTGRDAAPYVRVFNPVTQGERFDPDGSYVREWVPELRQVPGRAVHRPWTLGRAAPPDYPPPIVDHAAERRIALDDFRRGPV